MANEYGLATIGHSYGSIEKATLHVRRVLKLNPAAPIPRGVGIFEHIDDYTVKIEGKSVPLSHHVMGLPYGVEALAFYEADSNRITLALSESTYDDVRDNEPRARFSVGHELGHAVLHAHLLKRISFLPVQPMRSAARRNPEVRHPKF